MFEQSEPTPPARPVPRVVYYIREAGSAGLVRIWRPFSLLTGVGLLAAFAAIGAAGAILARADGIGWLIATALAALILILLIGGYRVWNKVEIAYGHIAARPRPHLVFAGTDAVMAQTIAGPLRGAPILRFAATTGPILGYADTTATYHVTTGGTVDSGEGTPDASADVANPPAWAFVTNQYVRALVANDPGEKSGDCARKAAAKIAFIEDDTDALLFEMIGRWAETPQRAETGRLGLTREESELDIEANALPAHLDIAMKPPEDADFYAYNHENCNAPDLCLVAHRITARRCRVRVTVRATNASPITRTFVLRNEGVGGGLRLEDVDQAASVL